MLLTFKRQFEPMVLDHSKRHTIRAKRKRRPRVGETCHCYGDARQKTIDIEIRVLLDIIEIYIEGSKLTESEARLFAWQDGFRPEGSSYSDPGSSLELMREFWIREHGGALTPWVFYGDIIYWHPEAQVQSLLHHGRRRAGAGK